MKTVIIIQARMTSTRLPGKVLREVLGKPLLAYQVERLRRVKLADGIVLATTTNPTDEPLAVFAQQEGLPCFRGEELDVLGRYYGAAQMVQARTVVRVTSDCPLIDPDIIDQVIRNYQEHPEVAYVSNTLQRSFPRGLDVECFSFEALQEAWQEAKEPYEREHVTPYLYQQERFKTLGMVSPADYSQHRWTVDTPEDFELIRLLLEAIYPQQPQFSWQDILRLQEQHPQWREINAHVEQKKLTEAQVK